MNYKKCPACGLNYITEDKELCSICMDSNKKSDKRASAISKSLSSGTAYGSNSKTVYSEFCDFLGFDRTQVGCFGFQTKLYAENADTDRKCDVWFICYPNYDEYKFNNNVKAKNYTNVIKDAGDTIIESFENYYVQKSSRSDTLVFVKTDVEKKYVFFGVYKVVENGLKRVYKRISFKYPY